MTVGDAARKTRDYLLENKGNRILSIGAIVLAFVALLLMWL